MPTERKLCVRGYGFSWVHGAAPDEDERAIETLTLISPEIQSDLTAAEHRCSPIQQ